MLFLFNINTYLCVDAFSLICINTFKNVFKIFLQLGFVFFSPVRCQTGLAIKESATRKTLANSRRRPISTPWRRLWGPDKATILRTLPTPQVLSIKGDAVGFTFQWLSPVSTLCVLATSSAALLNSLLRLKSVRSIKGAVTLGRLLHALLPLKLVS